MLLLLVLRERLGLPTTRVSDEHSTTELPEQVAAAYLSTQRLGISRLRAVYPLV
jgi:hypothetical protein